jgi:hypothetical protein
VVFAWSTWPASCSVIVVAFAFGALDIVFPSRWRVWAAVQGEPKTGASRLAWVT